MFNICQANSSHKVTTYGDLPLERVNSSSPFAHSDVKKSDKNWPCPVTCVYSSKSSDRQGFVSKLSAISIDIPQLMSYHLILCYFKILNSKF